MINNRPNPLWMLEELELTQEESEELERIKAKQSPLQGKTFQSIPLMADNEELCTFVEDLDGPNAKPCGMPRSAHGPTAPHEFNGGPYFDTEISNVPTVNVPFCLDCNHYCFAYGRPGGCTCKCHENKTAVSRPQIWGEDGVDAYVNKKCNESGKWDRITRICFAMEFAEKFYIDKIKEQEKEIKFLKEECEDKSYVLQSAIDKRNTQAYLLPIIAQQVADFLKKLAGNKQ